LDHPSGRYDFGLRKLDGHVRLIKVGGWEEVGEKLVQVWQSFVFDGYFHTVRGHSGFAIF
jgi:hypothetical protein